MTTRYIDDHGSTARLTDNPRPARPLSHVGKAVADWLRTPGKAGRYGLLLAGAKVFLGRHRPSGKRVAAGVGIAAALVAAVWILGRPRR